MARLYFSILYFLTWAAFFAVSRLLFLVFHLEEARKLTAGEVFSAFLYGARLDGSFAAYLSVIPFLVVTLSFLARIEAWKLIIRWYTYIMVLLVSLLQIADLQLYAAWGYRLDATPIQYINTPGEVAASVAASPLLLLIVLWLALVATGAVMFSLALEQVSFLGAKKRPRYFFLFGVLALAMLLLPLRGGWQQIPINQSFVYFSEKPFANQLGLNVPWNVMHGLLRHDYDQRNPYLYSEPQEAEKQVAALYPPAPAKTEGLLVSHPKPNVLLIILESYTANLVGCLGAEPGVTPNLDSLASEGLLFTRIYSSGDRSEKGLAAILSGYPAQPTTSVMKVPRKSQNLPYLSQEFRKAGYATSYYYGGELGFANLKSYLINGGFHRVTEKADFDEKDYNSKWGVHDHVLFGHVLQQLNTEKQPFFSTVFTLSSHEPYEIPVPAYFKGKSEEIQFRNSVRYTDQALGDFIRQAKKQPWWQSTLVVLIADHGHRFPKDVPNHSPEKFRIPMLFTGGALQQKGRIEKLGSQTDLATILLRHLGLPDQDFKWGKDLLSTESPEHAFYVFNNGFGWLTPAGDFVFDNVGKIVIEQEGVVREEDLQNGKAMMQGSYQDFLGR